VPRAIVAGIGLAVLLYLLLQLAFLNLHWLSALLYADAVVSPGGSAYVGVAIDARHSYALAKNGVLPRFFLAVETRSGIPRRALALNLIVILAFLLPFTGWQQIVSVVGDLYLLTYAAVAIAAGILVPDGGRRMASWVPPLPVLAPVAFVVATEFVYWSGWSALKWALPLSLLGSFGGGGNTLSAPWDSLLVAVVAVLTYYLSLASAGPDPTAAGPADSAPEFSP